jgi:flagellar hook assembly protein FlgD
MLTYDLNQIATAVDEPASLTGRVRVSVTPNPMNRAASFRISVPAGGRLTLGIYDVHGRRVRQLADRDVESGSIEVPWDGTDARGVPVSTGTYFYRASTPAGLAVGKITVRR